MDIDIMNKILWNLPEDIIREISSYFIFKIPKTDRRIFFMENFLSRRYYRLEQGFYTDGEFRYKLFHSYDLNIHFYIHCLPEKFITYIFGNFITEEQKHIRFWMDGKCEEHINGSWTIKVFYTFGHLKRRFSKLYNFLIFVFLFYFSHIQHLCYMLH